MAQNWWEDPELDTPEGRYNAWVRGGSIDYNALAPPTAPATPGGDQGNPPSAPGGFWGYDPNPSGSSIGGQAPYGAPPLQPGKGYKFNTSTGRWEQETFKQPWYVGQGGNGQGGNGQGGNGQGGSTGAGDGGQGANLINPVTGDVIFIPRLTPEQAKNTQNILNNIGKGLKDERDRSFGLESDKVNLNRMIADAQRAYQDALLKYKSEEMAMQAAKNAMEQSYSQQLLALQQEKARWDRRQRRPFRRAPVAFR